MVDFKKLQNNIKLIGTIVNEQEFLREFLLAYGLPKAMFARLQMDNILNFKPLRIANKMYYMLTQRENLYALLDELKEGNLSKIPVRFIFLANSDNILALDTVTEEVLSTSKLDLFKQYDFFLPLGGIEKSRAISNDSVDIKTAEIFAHLYNELLVINCKSGASKESIDLFIVRLLFCFFADSEGIIDRGTLHKLFFTYSNRDGSGLSVLFYEMFNRFKNDSAAVPAYIRHLPVLDFSLFEEELPTINFNSDCRKALLEISELNWSDISPDILGALIQSIVGNNEPESNSNFTSEPNIHNVIGPLFLNQLYECFEKDKSDPKACIKLLERISQIKILDPSCGTGNFLLITYKELRTLEFKIKQHLRRNFKIDGQYPSLDARNLYGIESNSLSCEVAKLGLLFTAYQMDRRFCEKGNDTGDLINGMDQVHISCANALRLNWVDICPNEGEVYVIGNPSYKGAHKQSPEQKKDVEHVFAEFEKMGEVDYAACYFYLAVKYINNSDNAFAFVTTNSLTQGQQVDLLWPKLFKMNVHISFAHTAFKWRNDAINNTAVTVVIIGMRNNSSTEKRVLYTSQYAKKVSWINPYLAPGQLIVKKRSTPISTLPSMIKGNMPYDDNYLLLLPEDAIELEKEYPVARRFLRRVVGSKEFINGIERWCLWIDEDELDSALSIPPIKKRVEDVKQMRLNKKDKNAQKLAEKPYQFREHRCTAMYSLVIPSVSSERRLYIPVGFVGKSTIVTNLAFVIYDCEPWIFAVVSSKMHNLWVRTVCGQLETRIRYSSQLGYNTFPFPTITEEQKQILKECVYMVLAERESASERPLAYMYNPDTMSSGLRHAHSILDKAIENCYRDEPFASDQERLDYLFELYNRLEVK